MKIIDGPAKVNLDELQVLRECYPKHKVKDQDEGPSGNGMARVYRLEFDSGTQTVNVHLHTYALVHAHECLCVRAHIH